MLQTPISTDVKENLTQLLQIENNTDIITKLIDVLAILSKEDALTIFLIARNGLKSELDTPQNIGLTKKQYYTRLKQLLDLGLLTKVDTRYLHTGFGKMVCEKHISDLANDMSNSKELEMIDVLKQSSKFGSEEIESFMTKLGLKKNAVHEIYKRGEVHNRILSDYDEMVAEVLKYIEFGQREILLVSRLTNDLIINALILKANAGLDVKVIADPNLVETFFENAGKRLEEDDKNKNERLNVVANPYYPSRIERKYYKVPYCILLVDDTHVGLEIVDSYNPKKFALSLFGEDRSLAMQAKDIFYGMWNKARTMPPQLVPKKT